MSDEQLGQLAASLESFCLGQALPCLSADEVLAECADTLSTYQRAWLSLFLARWDNAVWPDEFPEVEVPAETMDYLYERIREAGCTGRRDILAAITAAARDLDFDAGDLIDAYDRNEQGHAR